MQQTKLLYGLTQEVVDRLNSAGYVIVPRTPTQTMIDAGDDVCGIYKHSEKTWARMLEAADGQERIEK